MKKIVLFFSLLSISVFSQITSPIKWEKAIKDLGENTFEVSYSAKLQPNWHIYTLNNTSDFIIPTNVSFPQNKNVSWLGKLSVKGKSTTEYSEAFEEDLSYYSGTVVYSRRFKTNATKPFNLIAEVEFQVCDDEKCLAPEVIEIEQKVVPKNAVTTDVPEETKAAVDTMVTSQVVATENTQTDTLTRIPETEQKLTVDKNAIIIESLDPTKPLTTDCTEEQSTDQSLFILFGLGFLGGLIALITPCVYPLIPLTVSYFTKGSGNKKGVKNALIFATLIFLIFFAISTPFHLFNISSDIFNQISTNVYLNIFFFLMFIFFALSFFGYYDLTLPNKWLNKSDKLSESGGIFGLFFMALTLVIVSFSCTGPILGGLLGTIAGENGPSKLTAAFSGFGLSWALIFGAFALFPSFLKNLPKSGGWLNTVKVVLAFIELALALKFLSKADLVSNLFLIKREIFVLIWIVIAILTALYLLGFIRFPHDDNPPKIGWAKRLVAALFIGFALYLLPGLFPPAKNSTNLKLLSGLTPPISVSYYHQEGECIFGLNCFHDYFDAIEEAKKLQKPVLIDFTGHGCENCRKMEEFVWSEPDILQILKEDIILASLYVDEKVALENPYKIKTKQGFTRKIQTVGDKWSVFQAQNFNANTQPLYALVTPDGKVINTPIGGLNTKEDFKRFLQCGINYYKNSLKK